MWRARRLGPQRAILAPQSSNVQAGRAGGKRLPPLSTRAARLPSRPEGRRTAGVTATPSAPPRPQPAMFTRDSGSFVSRSAAGGPGHRHPHTPPPRPGPRGHSPGMVAGQAAARASRAPLPARPQQCSSPTAAVPGRAALSPAHPGAPEACRDQPGSARASGPVYQPRSRRSSRASLLSAAYAPYVTASLGKWRPLSPPSSPPCTGSPAPPGRGRVTRAKPNSRHFACGLRRRPGPWRPPRGPFYAGGALTLLGRAGRSRPARHRGDSSRQTKRGGARGWGAAGPHSGTRGSARTGAPRVRGPVAAAPGARPGGRDGAALIWSRRSSAQAQPPPPGSGSDPSGEEMAARGGREAAGLSLDAHQGPSEPVAVRKLGAADKSGAGSASPASMEPPRAGHGRRSSGNGTIA